MPVHVDDARAEVKKNARAVARTDAGLVVVAGSKEVSWSQEQGHTDPTHVRMTLPVSIGASARACRMLGLANPCWASRIPVQR
jgi:hypothetical protein